MSPALIVFANNRLTNIPHNTLVTHASPTLVTISCFSITVLLFSVGLCVLGFGFRVWVPVAALRWRSESRLCLLAVVDWLVETINCRLMVDGVVAVGRWRFR